MKIRVHPWLTLAIPALLFLLCRATEARPLEFRETDLQRVEERYEDSLDVAHHQLYRCGEIVRLADNPDQIAIVFDYRFDGKGWVYKIWRAHFAP